MQLLRRAGHLAACSPHAAPCRARRRSRSAPTPPSWAARWAPTAAGTSSTRSTRRCASGCRSIGIWHSGGARLAEGVEALDAVGEVFAAMVRASGRVPQISVVLGPAAGGAAYGPALTDVVIMGPAGRVFVTGPDVVRSVTGEDVDMERLGGPDTHGRRSGVVHVVTDSEPAALETARAGRRPAGRPGRVRPRPPVEPDVDLGGTAAGAAAARVRRQAARSPTCSTAPALELHPRWAPNIVTALGRLAGRTVGVVANNPMRLGGCLDSASAEKAARFVRMCDAFGVPLVVARRRARLPARRRPGVGRRGAARREAAARLRRGGRCRG